LWAGYTTDEIDEGELESGHFTIGASSEFILRHGRLSKGFVFMNACYGSSLNDDFIAAGARVATGFPRDIGFPQAQAVCNTFYSRLDGQEGLSGRVVQSAKNGLDLVMAGDGYTTLAPAVVSVQKPDTLEAGDKITITLDTKCDTWFAPDIQTFCDLELDPVRWVDSTTIEATLSRVSVSMVGDCTFDLWWPSVFSGNNWACLDGNTNPDGGFNARGPAHDDYEWITPVKPCDCDDWTGDLDCSYTLSPIDVVIIVNFVYKDQDARCYPTGWNCPSKMGDVNCDSAVNAVDVVNYINYVYKNWKPFPLCPDPCDEQQPNLCER